MCRGENERVGANDVTMEGAEVGKMIAESSVRHVLPSRLDLYFRSVLSMNHVRCRDFFLVAKFEERFDE